MTNSIAIIGLAGRFPACRNVDDLWSLLASGREGTSWPSDEDLLRAGVKQHDLEHPDYVRATLTLPDLDVFDAAFFGMSPRDAALMSPQHRLFLQCCYQALEETGWSASRFAGAIGVFGGCGYESYFARHVLRNRDIMDQTGFFLARHTGNDKDFLSTRVSYLLGLTGPSVGIQTACSTSLVAVHTAVQSLLSGECDLALAGGATIELPHGRGYRYVENEILSRDGHCRSFDDAATGTIFGSGVGIVALRRLDDALADGDPIRAVLLGTAVNNDGASKAGYLAPSVTGQVRAASEALAVAGIEGSSVDYVEAHGTGTIVGDPIELTALSQAYGRGAPRGSIGIGSIKSNIGHLDTAAGVASLIKGVLALERGLMPASLNCSQPTTRFAFANSPFRVVRSAEPWGRRARPRRIGLNSLGVGGTNAHAILEEAPVRPSRASTDRPQHVFLSAKSLQSLDNARGAWLAFAEASGHAAPFAAAAETSREARDPLDYRETVLATGYADLATKLAQPPRLREQAAASPSVVFLYPGGGAQFPGAAASLYAGEPVFRVAADAALATLPPDVTPRLAHALFSARRDDSDARRLLERPLFSVLSVFVVEIALTALWRHWGVKPAAVLGHSAGDYAAAVTAGVMSMRDAAACLTLRGRLFEELPPGGMMVLPTDVATARELVGSALDIAAVNTPTLTVVSGSSAQLDALAPRLKAAGVDGRRVPIGVAAHSRALDPFLPRYRELLATLKLSAPQIPMYSGLTGGRDGNVTSADYWVRHLREPVNFAAAMGAALELSETVFIEVGPGHALGAVARSRAFAQTPHGVVASLPHADEGGDDRTYAHEQCGRVWALGVTVDLRALRDTTDAAGRVSIPVYQFAGDRHWIDPDDEGSTATQPTGSQATTQPPAIERVKDPRDGVSALAWQSRPVKASLGARGGATVLIASERALSGSLPKRLAERTTALTVLRQTDATGALNNDTQINLLDLDATEHLVDRLAAAQPRPERIVLVPDAEAATAEARAHQVFAMTFNLCKALQTRDWPAALDVKVVTAQAWSIDGEAATAPEYAAVLGPCRVVPRELPLISAQVVDIAGHPHQQIVVTSALLDELIAPTSQDLVALRGALRHVEVSQNLREDVKQRLKAGGSYLLTGAAGGLGQLLARHLAETHKSSLTLVTRHPLPEAFLADLERLGGRARNVLADVTSEADMAAAIAAARASFSRVDGVFHLAAKLDDAVMATKSTDAAAAVLAPKVDGAFILDRLLPPGTLDIFALFSSTSALIGPPGQADYTAANAVLDALASRRPDGVAVNWGIWRDIGLTAAAKHGQRDAHPLLGLRKEPGNGQTVFEAVVSVQDTWLLSEHRVANRAILPGTAYLEIARAAIASVLGHRTANLSYVNFLAPLICEETEPRLLLTTVSKEAADRWSITVESRSVHGGHRTVHFEATITEAAAAHRQKSLQMPSLASLWPRSGAGHLAQAQGTYLSLGQRFSVLRALHVSGSKVVGVVQLPGRFADDLASYAAHPALVDIAATIGLFAIADDERRARLYAPLSIRALRGFGPLPARFVTTARLKSMANGIVTCDVTFSTPTGAIVATFEDFALKALDAGAFQPPPANAQTQNMAAMIAAGWTAADAPALFELAFNASEARVLASSMSLPALRARQLALAAPRKASAKTAKASADTPKYANPVEQRVAELCADNLGLDTVAPEQDFFQLGGQSLVAVRLFAKFRSEWKVDLPLATLFEARTIRALAQRILVEAGLPSGPANADGIDGASTDLPSPAIDTWSPLVLINPGTSGHEPIFCIHGAGGNVLAAKPLADALGSDTPFYGLQAFGVDGKRAPLESIPEMARNYLDAILAVIPDGPRCLIGYSGGGVIAFEMVHQLLRQGRRLPSVIMIDTLAPDAINSQSALKDWLRFARDQGFQQLSQQIDYSVRERLQARAILARPVLSQDVHDVRGREIFASYLKAQALYAAEPATCDVLLFRARRATVKFHRAGPNLGWHKLVRGELETIEIDADHDTIVAPNSAQRIADTINVWLNRPTAGREPQPIVRTAAEVRP